MREPGAPSGNRSRPWHSLPFGKDGRLILRYLIGGCANTALSYAAYRLLLSVLDYQYAYAISYVFGILTGYLINLKLVFSARHTWKKLLLFPLIYVAVYLVGALVLHVAVELLGVHEGLAPLLSIIATLPLSFLLTRWLLRQRQAAGTSVHEKNKVPYEQ